MIAIVYSLKHSYNTCAETRFVGKVMSSVVFLLATTVHCNCPWQYAMLHMCGFTGVSCEQASYEQSGNEVSCKYEQVDAIRVC